MRADQALAYLRLPQELERNRRLRILHECWPYELGWLLYAFSNSSLLALPEFHDSAFDHRCDMELPAIH
jgi:hypothetical protein